MKLFKTEALGRCDKGFARERNSNVGKKSRIRAAVLGLFLLVEGCATAPLPPTSNCARKSPEELRLAALEQRVEATRQKIEKAKQRTDELENKVQIMKRALYKKELEQLLLLVKKRTCEKFRKELEMIKSLAQYDEHRCVQSDSFEPTLKAKVTVYCPDIEYLTSLIRNNCR